MFGMDDLFGSMGDPFNGIDMGPVTQEELDNFYYNEFHPDRDDEDFEYRGGYGNHCQTTTKITRILKSKEFERYGNLVDKKSSSPSKWTAADQAKLEAFNQKLLSSTKEQREKVQQLHAHEREENQVAGQRVRIISTGKLGRCIGGCLGDSAGRGSYPIALDDPSELPIEITDRADLEILCKVCEAPSNQRCLRCKQAWYCGRDCQSQDWKSHKKECKKVVKEETASAPDDEAASEKEIRACAFCKTEAHNCCSRCKQVWYCGASCQRRHWKKEHKKECKAVDGEKKKPKSGSTPASAPPVEGTSEGGSGSTPAQPVPRRRIIRAKRPGPA